MMAYKIDNSNDGLTNTQSAFNINQPITDKTIFEIIPQTAPVVIKGVLVDVGSWYISRNASSTFQLEGYDGSSWEQLSAPMANSNTTDFTIENTMQVGKAYQKYRIQGVTGTSYYSGIYELQLGFD